MFFMLISFKRVSYVQIVFERTLSSQLESLCLRRMSIKQGTNFILLPFFDNSDGQHKDVL